tara:strand:+ start:235 stop:420 length:186 start_codon:yes stop_codon:yes gene_type:complete
MIDTDDLDNMSRKDLVELLEAYNESLAEVERLRKGIIDIADKWEQPSIIRGFLKELKELIE